MPQRSIAVSEPVIFSANGLPGITQVSRIDGATGRKTGGLGDLVKKMGQAIIELGSA
jgi:hypothetical protein